MRVITNPRDKARTNRIGNNISRHRDQILIFAQRVIIETALPDRSTELQAHPRLEPPNDLTQARAFVQLHQPMHMIGHHDKRQSLTYGID